VKDLSSGITRSVVIDIDQNELRSGSVHFRAPNYQEKLLLFQAQSTFGRRPRNIQSKDCTRCRLHVLRLYSTHLLTLHVNSVEICDHAA
jgi:hypothetical protein